MKLLTKEIEKKMPAIGATESESDPLAIVKFFHPLGQQTWYGTEYDPENREFFGYVENGPYSELGYFSLTELEQTRVMGLPMERDLYFKPIRLSEVQ
jgi:hypothetical protein